MSVEISSCNVSRIRSLGKSLIRRFKKKKERDQKEKRVVLHQWPTINTINNDNSLAQYKGKDVQTYSIRSTYIPHNHISKLIMGEYGSLR